MKQRIPRRLRKVSKNRKVKIKFCPWDGTAWADRLFCKASCKRLYEEYS